MADEEKSRRPKDDNFRQQRLSGWRIAPGPIPLALFYLTIAIVFIAYGAVVLQETLGVIEIRKRYDDVDECKTNGRSPTICVIDLEITSRMDSPVFVYYEINGMYQNHRRYAKSRDVLQLLGHDRSKGEINTYCQPVVDMADLGFNTSYMVGGALPRNAPANPCGLIAKSYFNDTYHLYAPGGATEVKIHEDDITWDVDREDKYSHPDDYESKQWTNVKDEHFMVWMSVSGLPNFRKLWGRIEDDLPKGSYRLLIENNYDVSGFSGEKMIVLSTTCAFGGKIEFLGVLYIVVGCISFVGAGVMLATFYCKKRYNIV